MIISFVMQKFLVWSSSIILFLFPLAEETNPPKIITKTNVKECIACFILGFLWLQVLL